MNLDDFGKDIKEMHKAVESILVSKNKDYSHSVDVHSNFTTTAQLCKLFKVDVTTPEGCMQYELIKKIYRMFKLINESVDPNHESLWDNSMDCHAYQYLLNSWIHEKMKEKKELGNLERAGLVETYPSKEGVPCD
jgi:hypothetical protein